MFDFQKTAGCVMNHTAPEGMARNLKLRNKELAA